ncbi:hypothetical protein [Nocardioides sp. YIM 152315]|uniref:hypothetical protein n=1 Tax=Nocardioides sp. YIM 152315 TaxID=3031760 RepID=UPI0023DB849F|nr:hypothetical protein [Nocardioides sp. YIM 152315]MDF1602538.1 hypothetical protein [Nocardioides sp. YIM 152315]
MRTSALVRLAAVVAATLLGTSLLSAGAAAADEAAPPVVVADTVTLWPGQMTQVDVLANDRSPVGDDLALCRFPEADFYSDGARTPHVVVSHRTVEILGDEAEPGSVLVGSRPRSHGTRVIDYYVCDHTHLVPATLTIVLRDVKPVEVTEVAGRKGLLSVTNDNDAAVRLLFGPRRGKRDGRVSIPAHSTRTVRIQRHTIAWMALIGPGSLRGSGLSSPGIAGHGIVKHIKIKGDPLPRPKGGDHATSALVPSRRGA